jgi:GMP synthase-like glutamine amidotransferase
MANCLVIQHVAVESAWAIGDALERAGVTVDLRRVDLGDPVPSDASDHDGVVVMGGPMSAFSDAGFSSRCAELTLLKDALLLVKPTLGVCLGAQLLALSAGGGVQPGEAGSEIGWSPVELSPESYDDALFAGLPRHIDVLHWHGDTFDAPAGSVYLAGNARYANQAFRVGRAAWGLQFHLEVTAQAVDAFVAAFAEEAADAPGGSDAILRVTPSALEQLRPWQKQVFDRLAGLIAVAGRDRSRGRFADISTP